MGWGKEWHDAPKELKDAATIVDWGNSWEEAAPISEQAWKDLKSHGQSWSQDGKHVPLEKIYKNIPPTHDPYTNPNAHIYYECSCGAILDPQTKSFAALNNYASEKGWKIRFGADSYVPYCVKCGEDVE